MDTDNIIEKCLENESQNKTLEGQRILGEEQDQKTGVSYIVLEKDGDIYIEEKSKVSLSITMKMGSTK